MATWKPCLYVETFVDPSPTEDTLAEAVRIAKPWGFSDGSTTN